MDGELTTRDLADCDAIALAHSLAGSSGTVGFKALSELARLLEHALLHLQPQGYAGALQIQLAQRIVQKGLSVREAERLAQHALKPPKAPEESKPDRDLLRLQEELSDVLGAQVEIRSNKKGAGKIQIEFGNLDQLEGILQRLR